MKGLQSGSTWLRPSSICLIIAIALIGLWMVSLPDPDRISLQRRMMIEAAARFEIHLSEAAEADSAPSIRYRRTPDGLIATVDAAQLATWTAKAGVPANSAELRRPLLDRFVVEAPDDPFIDGMVAWAWTPPAADETQSPPAADERQSPPAVDDGQSPPAAGTEASSPGEPLDVSGTTEALRTAEALLAGFDANHPASEPGGRRPRLRPPRSDGGRPSVHSQRPQPSRPAPSRPTASSSTATPTCSPGPRTASTTRCFVTRRIAPPRSSAAASPPWACCTR